FYYEVYSYHLQNFHKDLESFAIIYKIDHSAYSKISYLYFVMKVLHTSKMYYSLNSLVFENLFLIYNMSLKYFFFFFFFLFYHVLHFVLLTLFCHYLILIFFF